MKKIFAAIAAIFVSFSAWAGISLPIHMDNLVMTRALGTSASPLVDARVKPLMDPFFPSDIGFYSQFMMWFESGGGGYMGLQKTAMRARKPFSLCGIPVPIRYRLNHRTASVLAMKALAQCV